jgi:hypothetical protein
VIIGGTELIGSRPVGQLRRLGHRPVAASPDTGVNKITGQGVATALAGARVVLDVSNSPSLEDAAALSFFETSTRNVLASGATAGVGHHDALSVVGTERGERDRRDSRTGAVPAGRADLEASRGSRRRA